MQVGRTVAGRLLRAWRQDSPFSLLLATPVLTLPLAALLIFTVGGEVDAEALGLVETEWLKQDRRLDRFHYFYFDFWQTWALLTAPGIVNLLVVWWLRYDLAYVRISVALGLVLALLRTLVVPLAATLWVTGDLIDVEGLILRIPIAEEGDPSWPSPTQARLSMLITAWIGGLGMWLVTAGLWWAYEPLMARFFPRIKPPWERGAEEGRRWSGFARRA